MRFNFSRTGCSGVVYDGVNLSDIFQIVDIKIPLLPTLTAVTQELTQRPGAYFASRKVGTRQITMKLRLDAETRNPTKIFHAWREVSKHFSKEEPKKLYLNEDVYCWALVVGDTDIDNAAYYGEVEFTFMCYDPFFYGREHTFDLSANTAKTIQVNGDMAVYPMFDLTATSSTVKVTNVTTGDLVSIPNLKSGTKLHIDSEKYRVEVGGAYQPIDISVSDYFMLEGECQLKVTGASGTVTYQERYL